jgi:uncharacterized damage-inducible protein DinB
MSDLPKIRDWHVRKLESLAARATEAVRQLDDEAVRTAHPGCNSVAFLVIHMADNLRFFLEEHILGLQEEQDRYHRIEWNKMSKEQVLDMLESSFREAAAMLSRMDEPTLAKTVSFRGQTVQAIDLVLNCVYHQSEHVGQILHIAKELLGERYERIRSPFLVFGE